jgi:hypothetical protein
MNTGRIVGILLIVVGAILLGVGITASDSIADRLVNFFTGHFTDTTVWCMISGFAAVVGGLVLLMFKGGRVST